jgi:hypothetical protein
MNELDFIQSVKIQGESYLLNGNMSVPKVDGNREYELIKVWLETNEAEPEFTEEELAQQELNKKKQEALQYLADTAWYIERLADPSSGKAIPEEVLAKRAEAREILNELKGAQV